MSVLITPKESRALTETQSVLSGKIRKSICALIPKTMEFEKTKKHDRHARRNGGYVQKEKVVLMSYAEA
jgi:hypothetical protein